jgi:hypothetical protein
MEHSGCRIDGDTFAELDAACADLQKALEVAEMSGHTPERERRT